MQICPSHSRSLIHYFWKEDLNNRSNPKTVLFVYETCFNAWSQRTFFPDILPKTQALLPPKRPHLVHPSDGAVTARTTASPHLTVFLPVLGFLTLRGEPALLQERRKGIKQFFSRRCDKQGHAHTYSWVKGWSQSHASDVQAGDRVKWSHSPPTSTLHLTQFFH